MWPAIGEDRALTNLILEQGLKTVYQRKAVVHTIVPETYVQLIKMFLRWDRGDVREEWKLSTKVLWQRLWSTRWISIIDVFFTNLRYPMIYISLGLIIALVLDPLIVLQIIVAIGLMASFYMFFYLRSEKSIDFMYGIGYAYFSFFTLFWIFPYAVMTLRNRSWLTHLYYLIFSELVSYVRMDCNVSKIVHRIACFYDGLQEEDYILDRSPIEIIPIGRSFFRTGKCRT